MGQTSEDILQQVIDGLDIEELIDRLGYDIDYLVKVAFNEDILDNLEKFSDLFEDDE